MKLAAKFSLSVIVLVGGFLSESLAQTTPEFLKCAEGSDLFYPAECQNGTGSEFPVYFPFPEDCTQFFECTNGIARCLKCAAGTRWDQENLICNHDSAVDCIVVTTTSKPNIVEHPKERICKEGYTGLVRHPSDCRLFYLCIIGEEPLLFQCPDTLFFNPATDACDYQHNVPDCKPHEK